MQGPGFNQGFSRGVSIDVLFEEPLARIQGERSTVVFSPPTALDTNPFLFFPLTRGTEYGGSRVLMKTDPHNISSPPSHVRHKDQHHERKHKTTTEPHTSHHKPSEQNEDFAFDPCSKTSPLIRNAPSTPTLEPLSQQRPKSSLCTRPYTSRPMVAHCLSQINKIGSTQRSCTDCILDLSWRC